jgi:hypothetical protein
MRQYRAEMIARSVADIAGHIAANDHADMIQLANNRIRGAHLLHDASAPVLEADPAIDQALSSGLRVGMKAHSFRTDPTVCAAVPASPMCAQWRVCWPFLQSAGPSISASTLAMGKSRIIASPSTWLRYRFCFRSGDRRTISRWWRWRRCSYPFWWPASRCVSCGVWLSPRGFFPAI